MMNIPSTPSSTTTGTKKERKNWFIIQVNIIAAKDSFWTVYEKKMDQQSANGCHTIPVKICEKVLTNENESDVSGKCQRCHQTKEQLVLLGHVKDWASHS
jgi:hypothetical protein